MPSGQTDNTIGRIVGANLRAARLAKKYTQSKLARPDFSVSYISAIERGQIFPSLRALEILSNRLGLTPGDLLHGEDGSLTLALTKETPSPDQRAIGLELLQAQVAIQAGRYTQAIEQLHQLSAEHLTPQQQLQLKYLIGWAYSHTLQLQESEQMLREAELLARDTNTALRLQILTVLGLVYVSMHNDEQTLQTHAETLAQIERMQPQDPFFLAQAYVNLGQHYSYFNRLDEAIAAFQQALAASEEFVHPDRQEALYARLCEGYATNEAYQLATLNGHKFLSLSAQHSSLLLLGEIHYHLGRAMLKKEPEKAFAYLDAALQQDALQQNVLAQASIHTHMAAWFLTQGQLDKADEHAQQGHALVKDAGVNFVAAMTLLTLGRVAYAQKRYEAGDGYCQLGLEMLEALRACEEYLDQVAVYAQLLEDRGEAAKALSYLKRAYSMYQRRGHNE